MVSLTRFRFLCLILILIDLFISCDSSDLTLNQNDLDIKYILSRVKKDIDLNDSDSIVFTNPLANSSSDSNQTQDISWNEINENFDKVLSEEEVQQKWLIMEQNLKSGVRTLLRSIFPKIVAMSSDAKVSGNCSAGLLKWIVSLRHLKSWAVKMLDASGKPTSGIFEGVVTMFGNYEECLKIRVPDDDDSEIDDEGNETFREFFRGQYCVSEFKPWLPKKPNFYGMNSKMKGLIRELDDTVYNDFADLALFFHFITFRMDFCVPSTCTPEDIQRISSLIAKNIEFRARVLRCETAVDEVVWDWHQIITVSILSVLTAIVIISSLITLLIDSLSAQHIWFNTAIVRSLSLTTSWKSIFGANYSSYRDKPVPLYAMRTIVMIWIIIVHTVVVVNFQYFREMQTIKTLALQWPMLIFTNSLVQFECLILISAFSLAYYTVGKNTKQVFIFMAKKYLRVTPIVILIALITIVMPLVLSRGPVTEDFISKPAQRCQDNGLWNLLYVQNFFTLDKACLSNTWIFCVEMQLSIAFIPIILLSNNINEKTTKLFWVLLPFITIIGFFINAIIVYIYELPPNFFWTLPDPQQRDEYFYTYYYKPWTHLSVFAIGFYAGALTRFTKSNDYKTYYNSINSSTGWLISTGVIFALIYCCHDWVIGELPDPSVSAIYDGTHRIFWSLAYSWILFTLTKNSEKEKQNFIEYIVGNKMFKFVGRLTLVAYLTHPIIQTVHLSSQQQHLYSSTILMAYIIIGNIIFTYLSSFLISWSFEMPFCSLMNVRTTDKYNTSGEVVGNKCSKTHNNTNEIEMGNKVRL